MHLDLEDSTMGAKRAIAEKVLETLEDAAEAVEMRAPSNDGRLSLADRIEIAGKIAPAIRRGGKRRVMVERRDGTTVPIDDAALLRALAERTEIEIAVQEGERPDIVLCEVCKKPVEVIGLLEGSRNIAIIAVAER